jgi:hypothetical protein
MCALFWTTTGFGKSQNITKDRISQSTGALLIEEANNTNLVEVNLVEHFNKWSPYVRNFGLLMIIPFHPV